MTDHLAQVRDEWDRRAPVYDDEPDHGLRDASVRAAWRELLLENLPPAPAAVADLGCGSGSLAVLLAEEGYAVSAHDVSERMLAVAGAKADRAGVDARFVRGDASSPALAEGAFDAVLCRHVLWALPCPRGVAEHDTFGAPGSTA